MSLIGRRRLVVYGRTRFDKNRMRRICESVVLVRDDSCNGGLRGCISGNDQSKNLRFFGELTLVTEEPRSTTVRSVGISELYTLSKEDFLKALNLYMGFRNARQASLKTLQIILKRLFTE